MKTNITNLVSRVLLAVAALAMFTMTAQAQFDFFGQPRTIQLLPSKYLNVGFTNIGASVTNTVFTNSIDTHGADGIAKLDIVVFSNSCGNAIQAFLNNQIVGSVDNTNWIALSYATSTSTAVSYTNSFYSTNLVVTDTYLLPGTISTVTTGTAGYAPPNAFLSLLTPPLYTNTASVNQSASGVYSYGVVIQDAPRYIGLITTLSGTNVTYNVGGTLTLRKQY